jgi:hypothetical protein
VPDLATIKSSVYKMSPFYLDDPAVDRKIEHIWRQGGNQPFFGKL